jgi:hypothetical protein
MQPKNSSKNKGPPPPPDLLEAAEEANAQVESDLMESLGEFMGAVCSPRSARPWKRRPLPWLPRSSGRPSPDDQAMQAFAVALTAMNAYRESTVKVRLTPKPSTR